MGIKGVVTLRHTVALQAMMAAAAQFSSNPMPAVEEVIGPTIELEGPEPAPRNRAERRRRQAQARKYNK